MFDIGNGDKDKLKENMEEIKSLIENDDSQVGDVQSSREQSGQPQQSPQPADNMMDDDVLDENDEGMEQFGNLAQDQSQPQETQGEQFGGQQDFNEQDTQNQFSQGGAQNTSQEQQLQENTSQTGNRTQPGQPKQNNRNTVQNQQQDQQFGGSQQDQKEEMEASTTDRSSPPSSGETVFLTVERFHELQEKVEEMKYLSRQLEETADYLNSGVEEDEQTVQEAENVIEEFDRSRSEIRDIVSSHEN